MVRHAYGRASIGSKLVRHEPQCLIGCDAYAGGTHQGQIQGGWGMHPPTSRSFAPAVPGMKKIFSLALLARIDLYS
jgi:hypothetical protein